MSRPFREIRAEVSYCCLPDEGALLARTSQRYRGILRSSLALGRLAFTSMYGVKPTPYTDDLLTSLYRMHRWDATTPR